MRVAFSNAQKSWEETDDLVTSLATTLKALGHEAKVMGDWVEFGGFSLLPQVVNVEPLENSGVKTAITIQVAHDALIPGGIFEYQHSSGTDLRDSFAKAFQSWADLDLPVFLDAQRAEGGDLHGHANATGSPPRVRANAADGAEPRDHQG